MDFYHFLWVFSTYRIYGQIINFFSILDFENIFLVDIKYLCVYLSNYVKLYMYQYHS